ncbi:Beclin-1-like protein [Aphelenchoides bicaudatus]|nr:Beclin-1-like protein [Aphelenchoides bicaudatus]
MASLRNTPTISASNCCFHCQTNLELHSTLNEGASTSNNQLNAVFENRNNEGSNSINSGKLLELLCNANSLDMPLCKECCASFSTDLDNQLKELELSCREYERIHRKLLQDRVDNPYDKENAKRELDALKAEETSLLESLADLEHTESDLIDQLNQKQDEQRKMTEQDDILYKKLRDNHRKLAELSDERHDLNTQIKYATEQRKSLLATNVLDMGFFIWKDGEYGTINGLRLGRLPNENVEWVEINAAFGQIAMLLVVMCQHVNLTLEGYEVVPCGSHSFIRVTEPGKKMVEHRLYGSGSWKPFGDDHLDHGIVSFVRCFCQLESKLKESNKGVEILPYKIDGEKIKDRDSDYNVRTHLNSAERWTKAMKCLLFDLKQVIGILAAKPADTSNNQRTLDILAILVISKVLSGYFTCTYHFL